MARRRHRHRDRRARRTLLSLVLLGGTLVAALVLPGVPLGEPAPAPSPATSPTSAPAPPRYRVVPRGPCPPGEQSYTVVDTAERTEWLCVRVTSPERP